MAAHMLGMSGAWWIAALAATYATVGCGGKVVLDRTGMGGSGGAGAGTTGSAGGFPSSLVGTWQGSAGGPTRLDETLQIQSDGTVTAQDSFEVVGNGSTPCSGALDISDDWTATATTFSVSNGTCTGQVSCPNGQTIPCGTAETESQTCTYMLLDGGDTLELDCPAGNGPITYHLVIPD
jgi:hypothetical protein